jgi:hypothetical protein
MYIEFVFIHLRIQNWWLAEKEGIYFAFQIDLILFYFTIFSLVQCRFKINSRVYGKKCQFFKFVNEWDLFKTNFPVSMEMIKKNCHNMGERKWKESEHHNIETQWI